MIKAANQIKELIKKQKDLETTAAATSKNLEAAQSEQALEELVTIKGKREVLENVVIRPNIVGKKTVGNLEIHQNGCRFTSNKGQNVDVAFSNIKHAFFQPCRDDELIVIIHFHLKTPQLIGSKKVSDV